MIRPSNARSLTLPFTLLLALLAGACNSGGESTRPANSNANANSAGSAANAPGTNAANANAASAAATQTSGVEGRAKLNLNTASEDDFMKAIPGMGKRMTHEFEEYRPYKSIQQFRREMGKYVKPEQIAEYEKYVFVPITPNESDAATLQQIPGLDATEAEALIAARPYASDDAFLAKLAGSVSSSELSVARSYLNKK